MTVPLGVGTFAGSGTSVTSGLHAVGRPVVDPLRGSVLRFVGDLGADRLLCRGRVSVALLGFVVPQLGTVVALLGSAVAPAGHPVTPIGG